MVAALLPCKLGGGLFGVLFCLSIPHGGSIWCWNTLSIVMQYLNSHLAVLLGLSLPNILSRILFKLVYYFKESIAMQAPTHKNIFLLQKCWVA